MIGLPGTGLGGIFYILLVVWMGMRELWLLAQSASNYLRWKKIAKLGSLSIAILGALWFEGWSIHELFISSWMVNLFAGQAAAGQALPIERELAVYAIVPMMTIAPFVILAALMIGVHAARLLLRQKQKTTIQRLLIPAAVEIPASRSR